MTDSTLMFLVTRMIEKTGSTVRKFLGPDASGTTVLAASSWARSLSKSMMLLTGMLGKCKWHVLNREWRPTVCQKTQYPSAPR